MVQETLHNTYPRHIVAVSGVVTDPRGRVLLVKGTTEAGNLLEVRWG